MMTTIRPAAVADAAQIAAIYNHYISQTIVSFEEEPVSAGEIARRLQQIQSGSMPYLVAEDAGRVVGYAYASKWRERSAYRFTAESTVYLAHEVTGRGIGSQLYAQLFPLLEAQRMHVVVGCIALPNPASVALHEKFQMRKVAHLERVGFKLDRWVDVGYWQRTL
jgi:phosphinothricin acetyltransferase